MPALNAVLYRNQDVPDIECHSRVCVSLEKHERIGCRWDKKAVLRRVIFLVSNMNLGGAQRVAATLCNVWTNRGDEVALVATYSGAGECFYDISRDVKFIYLADLVGAAGKTPLGYVKRLSALRRLIKGYRPDVVVSFLTNVNIAAILATRKLGIPVIACERNDPVAQADLALPYRWLRRFLYPLAEMVTVQSMQAATRFRAAMPGLRRLEVVSNPLPSELLTVPRPETNAERKRLIAMGRLSPQKQFDLLIETFAELAPRFPNWDLCIVGEGPLRADLVGLAANLRVTGRVFMPGRTNRPWEELSRSDVFVLSSAYEGFPNALLEAMALGVPCVTFDCPSGPREMTRNGADALLVPPNDRTALSDALAKLMSDAGLRRALGSQAMSSVRSRYSIETVLNVWDELMNRVMKDRPAVVKHSGAIGGTD